MTVSISQGWVFATAAFCCKSQQIFVFINVSNDHTWSKGDREKLVLGLESYLSLSAKPTPKDVLQDSLLIYNHWGADKDNICPFVMFL